MVADDLFLVELDGGQHSLCYSPLPFGLNFFLNYFILFYFIYLFIIFGCVGSSFLCEGFL